MEDNHNPNCHDHEHKHGHGHGHHHHQHHHHSISEATKNIFLFCIAINCIFVITEAAIGYKADSISLISDSGHNLSDVLGLILAYIAYKLEQMKDPNSVRKSRWLSLVNALLLLLAVIIIVWESFEKIMGESNADGSAMIITAMIAIFVNGLTAYLLKDGKDNVNVRAAYLHAATDMLVSVGVVLAGVIIYYTGFVIVDPIFGLLISLIIAIPTIKLIAECVSHLKEKN